MKSHTRRFGVVGLGISLLLSASAVIAQPPAPEEVEAARAANNAPSYKLEDLGVLPGATYSHGVAIDDRGTVIGDSGNLPFTYGKDLKPFPATTATRLLAICDGQVGGINFPGRPSAPTGTKGGPAGDGTGIPFYHTNGSGMVSFTLPGYAGAVEGISRHGVKVGTASASNTCDPEYARQRAFLWNRDDSVLFLPVGKAYHSSAAAINGNGTVACGLLFGGSSVQGIIWYRGGDGRFAKCLLSGLNGAEGHPSDVNNRGMTVGWYITGQKVKMFRAYTNGVMEDITPYKSIYTDYYPTAVNDKDVIVGYAFDSSVTPTLSASPRSTKDVTRELLGRGGGASDYEGWIMVKGKMYFLKDLVPSSQGWKNLLIQDINNSGDLTGTGIYNGKTRAFRARLVHGQL